MVTNLSTDALKGGACSHQVKTTVGRMTSVAETCSFCRIVRGDELAHVIYDDASSVAFLDRAPAAEGHTLVVPRVHARTLLSTSIQQSLAPC